jgi:tetratricopeptide (TPR) repeat protein/outer membrane protein OmpA-like peptidoglycan-associated protein
MNKYLFFLILSFLLFSGYTANGQSLKAYLLSAENSFEEKDYGSALRYYLMANEFVDDDADLLYKSAESARLFKAYNLAESRLEYLDEIKPDSEHSLVSFWLGDIKQRLGKYAEAIDYYNIYISEHEGENEYFDMRARKEIEACEWASKLILNPAKNIKITRLEGDINTPYTEFGAMELDGDFYYTSMSFTREKDTRHPKRLISKILKLEGGVSVVADDIFSDEKLLNAHLSFNTNRDKAYFTICDYAGTVEIRCHLYSVDVNPDGTFGAVEKLPDFINDPNYTTTQPSVGFCGFIRKEILFFVSDREGGKGKMDIWYSIINNNGKTYTRPQNIEQINTAEDEVTPFFHSPTNTLYFSSSGYLGMGGFDIYASYVEGDIFGKQVHQGYPLNSSYDDIYFWLSDDGKKAYFSSNREGALYLDPSLEACCYDIFQADITPVRIDLIVNTINKNDLQPLNGTQVSLYEITSIGKRLIGTKFDPLTNLSKFEIWGNKNYLVVASKLGFAPDSTTFNTFGRSTAETIIKNLYLEPLDLNLKVFTFDKITENDLLRVTITLKNLTDNTIRQIAITNETGNEFNFDLIRGHKYEVTASKDWYESVSKQFSTDQFGGTLLIENLYLADMLNAYLPLMVYFDNDRPDPRTSSKVTQSSYSQTYDQYRARKDDFVRLYTRDIADPSEQAKAREKIVNFFDKDVKEGKEKHDAFMASLLTVLEAGHKVSIQLKGYASPRANYDYNLILAHRRVRSVNNEIHNFRNGALQKYIRNGNLKISDISFGSATAPDYVSDDLADERASIYSVDASRERRVEVISITFDNKENEQ